jgi:GTPase SAR1 family protein
LVPVIEHVPEESFTRTAVAQKKEEVLEAVAEELKQRKERKVGSCCIQNSVRGNERKKLLVIGKTGTGKSSLCNVLTGNLPNAKAFPVSSKSTTCTQETTFADANFCGVPSKSLSIIDTIGFDDPTKDHDAKIIADLVLQLQQNCDYVNTFVMAVNGQNPRLDGSLLQMIKIFEKMFTSKFWDQVVVVFTRLHMDQSSIERRLEENEGNADDVLAKEYLAEIERLFGVETSRLNYLFLDSQYRRTDIEEVQAFFNHSKRLYDHLMRMPGLPTSEITTVLTENQRLWAKINKLQVAMGGAAVGGVAALGIATVKSAVAEAAVKEAARAVAEKAAAETAASVAEAELAKLTQQVAATMVAPLATAATATGYG